MKEEEEEEEALRAAVNFCKQHNSVSSAGRLYIKAEKRQIRKPSVSVAVSIQTILKTIDVLESLNDPPFFGLFYSFIQKVAAAELIITARRGGYNDKVT